MKFQSVKGMRDIFEEDLYYFRKIKKACEKLARYYDYQEIRPPILEQTELFEKGTGLTTDIVEKEMYSLRTKGGDRLTLRPELTPSVVRAYIEHGCQALPKPVKFWYFGPVFRHERPQAGRYRQFHQFGFESFGAVDPVIDAGIVLLFYNIFKELGVRNLVVEVNSIGDKQCRPYFKKSLLSYLRAKSSSLCADCKRRLKQNPLRVLDCKEEKCQRVKKSAPQLIDHLCKECHSHFKLFLEFLDEMEVPYSLNPFLVRGLDYYTKTVFEIYEDTQKGRQQGSLAGGGRYDDLIKLLGGKDSPACGAAGGVERLVNLIKKQGAEQKQNQPLVFLAQVGDLAKKKGVVLLDSFRKEKIKMGEAIHKDSLTSQLKTAGKKGVKYVLILGQKEALENKIIIREMKTGRQRTVALNSIIREIKRKVK